MSGRDCSYKIEVVSILDILFFIIGIGSLTVGMIVIRQKRKKRLIGSMLIKCTMRLGKCIKNRKEADCKIVGILIMGRWITEVDSSDLVR